MKKSRFVKKKRRGHTLSWKRIFLIGGLSLFLFGILYLLFFSSPFQVREIHVLNGTSDQKIWYDKREVPERLMHRHMEEYLTHSFFGVETQSTFLIPGTFIREEFLEQFPYIEDISIQRKFPDGVEVIFFEKEPIGKVSSGGNLYLIDKEGMLFFELSHDVDLVEIQLGEGNPVVREGDRFMEARTLSLVLTMQELFESEYGESVTEIQFFSSNQVRFYTRQGWYMTATITEDINLQVVKLVQVLNLLSDDELQGLEYIDVRFRRVYYR